MQPPTTSAAQIEAALTATDSSARLEAALAAGKYPDPEFIKILVARCAIEPDFYVRDMLTWALTRHPHPAVIERLLPELESSIPQARSQTLHTLSKIGDPSTWHAITPAHLQDPDDDVARAAWRAAAGLVPPEEQSELARLLARQFGRGDREVQLSLTRAFVELGHAALPQVELATHQGSPDSRFHAAATRLIMEDPSLGFEAALADARGGHAGV